MGEHCLGKTSLLLDPSTHFCTLLVFIAFDNKFLDQCIELANQAQSSLLESFDVGSEASEPNSSTHHHKGNGCSCDASDVPGELRKICFIDIGDKPQPGMQGKSDCDDK